MNEQVEAFISENPDWYLEDEQLVAGFEFSDFSTIQKLIPMIMELAEVQNHHPTVTFGYNTIEVKTVTHDAGNTVTEKDFKLAKAISEAIAG